MAHIQLSKGSSCIRGLVVFRPAEEVDPTGGLGATETEIQDSVLIAAAYIYNRDFEMYSEHGRRLPEQGFLRSIACLSLIEQWVEREYV